MRTKKGLMLLAVLLLLQAALTAAPLQFPQTEGFRKDLLSTGDESHRLSTRLDALDTKIVFVLDVIKKTEDTSKTLSRIDTTFKVLIEVGQFLELIPPLRSYVSPVVKDMTEMRKPFTKAADSAKKIADKMQPVKKVLKPTHEAVHAAARYIWKIYDIVFEHQKKLAALQSCIQDKPDGPARVSMHTVLEAYSQTADPFDRLIDKAFHGINSRIDAVEKKLETIRNKINFLPALEKDLALVRKVLDPLYAVLKQVRKVLDKTLEFPRKIQIRVKTPFKVKVKFKKWYNPFSWKWHFRWETHYKWTVKFKIEYFKFSIASILRGLGGAFAWVEHEARKAADKLIHPLMSSLNKLHVPVPKIPLLDKLHFDFGVLDGFGGILNGLGEALRKAEDAYKQLLLYFEKLSVTCP